MATEHQTGGRRSTDDLVVGLTGARFGGAAGRRSRAVAPPPTEQDVVATHHHRAEQQQVGQTGARFSTGVRRWGRRNPDAEHSGSGLQTPGQPIRTDRVDRQAETTPLGTEQSRADDHEWVDWSEPEAGQGIDGLVRPYFWTRGRTASRFDLSLETLVSATGQPIGATAPPEHRTILTLCDAPRSVAELAALVSIPLGVARVVLGDMAEAGSLVVHRAVGSADAFPDIALMQRVLNGLQRL